MDVVSAEATSRTEWPGICSICDGRVSFQSHGPWHRDELLCSDCGSIPRQRALITVLSIVQPDWRDRRIWEVAPAGPASARLQRECHEYVSSHYWPEVPLGTTVDGVRCEDVEHATFGDGSFDLVISSDVFEHVVDVDAGLAEIARVLSPSGLHVWTTPMDRGRERSAARVRRNAATIDHLVLPEYHGNPISPDGALVTFDWGLDLPARVEAASSMSTVIFRVESRRHGLLGEFLEVFVSRKGGDRPVVVDQSQRLVELESETARLADSLAASEARLRDASEAVDASAAALRAVLASRSWRITAPLRSVVAATRRDRGDRR
jgi:SAM-dependent methyltransferase